MGQKRIAAMAGNLASHAYTAIEKPLSSMPTLRNMHHHHHHHHHNNNNN
jgi:hypothetical protein